MKNRTLIRYSFFSILLIMYFAPTYCIGQSINPEYGFNIYVTNAIGNIDSVFVGLDPSATSGIDSDFEEVDIKETPFEGVLDVRIANDVYLDNTFDGNYYFNSDPTHWHTKRQVFNLDCAEGILTDFATILVRSEHYPLTFSWDKEYFTDSCFSYSIINFMNFTGWFDIGSTYTNGLPPYFFNSYLKDSSSFSTIEIPFFSNTINYLPEYYIDDNQDTIRMLYLGILSKKWLLANNIEQSEKEIVKVYPNPATEIIFLQFSDQLYDNKTIRLYNLSGQLLYQTTVRNNNFQINTANLNLNNGLYFLKIQSNNQTINKVYKIFIKK